MASKAELEARLAKLEEEREEARNATGWYVAQDMADQFTACRADLQDKCDDAYHDLGRKLGVLDADKDFLLGLAHELVTNGREPPRLRYVVEEMITQIMHIETDLRSVDRDWEVFYEREARAFAVEKHLTKGITRARAEILGLKERNSDDNIARLEVSTGRPRPRPSGSRASRARGNPPQPDTGPSEDQNALGIYFPSQQGK